MPSPIITVAQMREWEKVTWASGVAEDAVMRRAGQAVARLVEKLTRPGDLVLFLAGKGHNGDDVTYACDFTNERQRELLRVIDPEVAAKEIVPHLDRKPALVVDGLFGIGLNRSLSGAWLKLIEILNKSGRPILAVDVPSGLNADTGLPLDDAVHANCTLTFGAVKQGLVKNSAAPFVGRLEGAAEIGLVPYPFTTESNWIVPEDFADYPPRRPASGHKGIFGHVVILAGSTGYHGAAILAARGAQRAQPGLITLHTMPAVYVPIAAQLQSVMAHPWEKDLAIPRTCTVILIGPGLAGKDVPGSVQELVRKLWRESPLPLIVDASALDWLPEEAVVDGAIRVITPHPGEAARMLGSSSAEVQQNRAQALRELSRRFGQGHVVLKGHHTLIGRGKAEISVNSSGNPHLAQGGSGDLLSGYLAGLLAQPHLQENVGQALRFGVWQHGAAADWLLGTRPNFTVEDLAGALGGVRA
jgi:NAD(P)H-hydrate epimerase